VLKTNSGKYCPGDVLENATGSPVPISKQPQSCRCPYCAGHAAGAGLTGSQLTNATTTGHSHSQDAG
jgi:hypothetical protein